MLELPANKAITTLVCGPTTITAHKIHNTYVVLPNVAPLNKWSQPQVLLTPRINGHNYKLPMAPRNKWSQPQVQVAP